MENQILTGWYYLIKHKCDLVFVFAYLLEISFLMIRTFNEINVYISATVPNGYMNFLPITWFYLYL